MLLYYTTILVIVMALVLIAHFAGWIEPPSQRPPIGFWIAIGTVLFLGFIVLPNT